MTNYMTLNNYVYVIVVVADVNTNVYYTFINII